MSTVTLTKVFRKDKETRFGIKPQLSIKTEQHGDKWLSTWNVKGTENWTEGMEVQINIQENGEFLNFKPAASASGAGASNNNSALESRVKRLEDAVFGAKKEAVIEAGEFSEAVDEAF